MRSEKLLNTVYVTTEGASVRKDGENFVAEVDGVERARVPFHMMSSVVVFGAIFVSPPLMQALALLGITIVLLDRAGRFQARIEGPVSGNVLLRCAQYRASENPDEIVRSIVSAKVMPCCNGRCATTAQRWRRISARELTLSWIGSPRFCVERLLRMREWMCYAAPRARPRKTISLSLAT